jgi:HSP20 family molecular chaperone IbpA
VPLPVRVKNTEASVDYSDGILTVTLPKADEEVNQVITLNLQS